MKLRTATILALTLLAVAPAPAADPATPLRAAVLEHRDARTGLVGLARQLADAGFVVEELDLSTPAAELDVDLIAFGSFVAERGAYRRYVRKHADGLQAFVGGGGVVLQMTQDATDEPSPPFLPPGLEASRSDQDFLHLQANPEQPSPSPFDDLLLDHPNGRFLPLPGHPSIAASWEGFESQRGFRVLLWSDEQEPYGRPAFLEGAHGTGRFLLTSLYLDRVYARDGTVPAEDSWRFASDRFFLNLHAYVGAVRDGTMPPPSASVADPPEPLPWEPGSWTLAVIPDSQMYARDDPATFAAQARWIVDHAAERDVRFVAHVGDVVNRSEPAQWRVAQKALDVLFDRVPWSLTAGNHDYDPGTAIEDRETMLRRYFPVERFAAQPGWGGTFEAGRVENNWMTFEAGGRGWLVLHLEWMPRDAVLEWAAGVLRDHADRSAIVVTHAHLRTDDGLIDLGDDPKGSPYQHLGPPYSRGENDGTRVWDKLLRRHANVAFVFSGHVTGDGAGRRTRVGDHGNAVHQVLANYQQRVAGGEGYLRLVEFLPDGRTVQVRTYSPSLERYMTWPEHQFVLPLPPPPPGATRDPGTGGG